MEDLWRADPAPWRLTGKPLIFRLAHGPVGCVAPKQLVDVRTVFDLDLLERKRDKCDK